MIADNNKNISNIQYNHLNLPLKITFGTGNDYIAYTYDATGRKVKKTVKKNNTVAETDYIGGFQYNNNILQFFPHAEGYIDFTELNSNDGEYRYVYQYKDHLGNIRLSYSDGNDDGIINSTTELLKENNYYPFGLEHTYYNGEKRAFRKQEGGGDDSVIIKPVASNSGYQYKYNGKELQDELGLNMYAMDMRQYDPALARWVVQDPVIHHSMSPYTTFDNNPVFWADPSGADSGVYHSTVVNGRLDTSSWRSLGFQVQATTRMKMGVYNDGGGGTSMSVTDMFNDSRDNGVTFWDSNGSSGFESMFLEDGFFDVDTVLDEVIVIAGNNESQQIGALSIMESIYSSEWYDSNSGSVVYIKNNSKHVIYFKPEEKMTINKFEFKSNGAYPLTPGQSWNYPVDGVATKKYNDNVFKIPNTGTVIVTSEGGFNLDFYGFGGIGRAAPSIGWIDKEYISDHNKDDRGWDALFKKAKQIGHRKY